MSLKRYCVLAMMLSISIVLSILESFIPVFIPGVKLGLANVIILILLYEFSAKEAFLVNVLRILLVGVLRSTLLTPTFLMSLSGGILSFVVMWLFSKMKFFSIIGVSVIGAFCHSLGQIIAAIIIMSLSAVVYYLPFIGILSVATGVFTGIITKTYLSRSITKKFVE
jgi:heptaprenyl diphosphate synthase